MISEESEVLTESSFCVTFIPLHTTFKKVQDSVFSPYYITLCHILGKQGVAITEYTRNCENYKEMQERKMHKAFPTIQ